MIYEITFNPSVFDACDTPHYWQRVEAILHDIELNGIVVMLRGGALRKEIAQRVTELPPQERDRILAILSAMSDQGRFFKAAPAREEAPRDAVGWLREAMAVHDRDGLFACLARQDVLEKCDESVRHCECLDVETARDSERWRRRKQSCVIERERGSLVGALTPMLRHSKRVRIVDYLLALQHTDKSRHRNAESAQRVIAECLRAWGAGSQRRREFCIDTEMPDMGLPYVMRGVSALAESLRCAVPKDDSTVTVRLWERRERRRFTKDRYLITNLGVVHVGKGFDAGRAEAAVMDDSLSLMEPPGNRKIEEAFDELDRIATVDVRNGRSDVAAS